MFSIAESVTEELNLLGFFGACDKNVVADLIAREIRECCPVHQETGKVGSLLQRLKGVMGAVRLLAPTRAAFAERVQDAMEAIASGIVAPGLDTRQITKGAVLGVLRAASECNMPENVAISEASDALIGHIKRTGGDLTATACGIVEGAIENARLSHRSVPSATSAAVLAVASAIPQCDRDAVEDVARGMARFVRMQADHFVVETDSLATA